MPVAQFSTKTRTDVFSQGMPLAKKHVRNQQGRTLVMVSFLKLYPPPPLLFFEGGGEVGAFHEH